jgi:hypothetical protein
MREDSCYAHTLVLVSVGGGCGGVGAGRLLLVLVLLDGGGCLRSFSDDLRCTLFQMTCVGDLKPG